MKLKKVLDLMAAACLLFDVDWEEEFGDDAYVIACREERELRRTQRKEVAAVSMPAVERLRAAS